MKRVRKRIEFISPSKERKTRDNTSPKTKNARKRRKMQQLAVRTKCHSLTKKQKQQKRKTPTPWKMKEKAKAAAAKPRLKVEEKSHKELRSLYCRKTWGQWAQTNDWMSWSENCTGSIGMWYWSPKHGAKTKRFGRHSKVTSWLNQANSSTNTESQYCWTKYGKTRSNGCIVRVSALLQCRSQSTNTRSWWWACTCHTVAMQITMSRRYTKRLTRCSRVKKAWKSSEVTSIQSLAQEKDWRCLLLDITLWTKATAEASGWHSGYFRTNWWR